MLTLVVLRIDDIIAIRILRIVVTALFVMFVAILLDYTFSHVFETLWTAVFLTVIFTAVIR